jgi:hypothetical protein
VRGQVAAAHAVEQLEHRHVAERPAAPAATEQYAARSGADGSCVRGAKPASRLEVDRLIARRHWIATINEYRSRPMHVVDDHRLAVLEDLKIDRNMVSKVRGVMIAGRGRGNVAPDLHRLKGINRGNVSLLTYDDLANIMATLAQHMAST